MCQDKISRLLKKYGDTFDTVFFRMVENLVGPGKTDMQILSLVKTKQTDRKISSIRHQGHIISDKIIERWFDYLGASADEISDIKLLAEYFRNTKKAKNLKIDGNPMFEETIFIESAVPIKKDTNNGNNLCVETQEMLEPEVRVLGFDELEELRSPVSFVGRVLEFAYFAGNYSLSSFSEQCNLGLAWFNGLVKEKNQSDKWKRRIMKELAQEKLNDSLANWLRDGVAIKPFDVILSEFRASISPHSNSIALKANGNSL